MSLSDPRSYLTFYAAPWTGHTVIRSAAVNLKWEEPPDVRNYSVQLNAISQKYWAQVVIYFDAGDHVDNHIDFWTAGRHPLGFWYGEKWVGQLTGQFDTKLISQTDFDAGRRSMTLGYSERTGTWVVFDETVPHGSDLFRTTYSEIFWGKDDATGALRMLEPAACSLAVVGEGEGAAVKFGRGRLHAHWGFDVPVAYANDANVTVGGERYQNGTGEQSNMCSTLDSLPLDALGRSMNSAEQTVAPCGAKIDKPQPTATAA